MKNMQTTLQASLSQQQSESSGLSGGETSSAEIKLACKIAWELLSSRSGPIPSNVDFYSPSAAAVLEQRGTLSDVSLLLEMAAKDSEEDRMQFKVLNGGGADVVNYKKMLEFLAEVMKFKVNYQSLLGRDGTVYSYVNLSILPETDKPLNGNGSTHIESSNSASLCALQYLASKHQAVPGGGGNSLFASSANASAAASLAASSLSSPLVGNSLLSD